MSGHDDDDDRKENCTATAMPRHKTEGVIMLKRKMEGGGDAAHDVVVDEDDRAIRMGNLGINK